MGLPYLLLLTIGLSLLPSALKAQPDSPFAEEVRIIQAYDQIYPPPEDPILFTGSSSIRLWQSLQQDFGRYKVLNRGIGGAVIQDIKRHLDALVIAYKPRQLVLYVGENDLMQEGVTADTILQRTQNLLTEIQHKLPDTPILYLSIKPSPSRAEHLATAREANRKIEAHLATQPGISYIDIFNPMLKEGQPRPGLFVADMLHMNTKGYRLWKKALKRHLIKAK